MNLYDPDESDSVNLLENKDGERIKQSLQLGKNEFSGTLIKDKICLK